MLEHRAAEGDDLGDDPVLHPQDVDRQRFVRGVARLAHVARDRGLTVGAGDHAPHAAERLRSEPAVDPALHDRASAGPDAGRRRHREADVLVHERGQALGVGALAALDVAGEQLPLGGGRLGGVLPRLAVLGQALPQPGPRALQRGVHRRLRRLEQPRGLLRRAAEDVAQHEHGPRQRREVLDRGDERQLDGLLGERHVLRALAPVGQLLEELVGIGLQPRDLAARARPPRALVERVEAGVRRDPVQPRANRRAALVRLAPAPRAQERLLDEVLGLLERPEQAVAVDVQLAAVRLDAGAEGLLVERPEVIGDGAHGVCDGGRPESSSPGAMLGPLHPPRVTCGHPCVAQHRGNDRADGRRAGESASAGDARQEWADGD